MTDKGARTGGGWLGLLVEVVGAAIGGRPVTARDPVKRAAGESTTFRLLI